MGYFDSVRGPHTATTIPAPRNVMHMREEIHPYAQAIRAAWLTRLDQLERPWVKGASWDTNCFVTARKLIELANSPWSGYKITDAQTDYMAHAPRDNAWDGREKCWRQAMARSGGNALPEPEPQAAVPDVTTLDLDAEVAAAAGPPLNDILDWHELFAGDDDGEEWIIEPILPARRMVALYSAPKAGKSLLMLEIAVAIARGTEVIGTKPDCARRVLYVDFENDPRGDVRSRLEAMEVGPDQLANLCYLTFPSLAKFDTAQGALDLMRHVEHYDCEVVVIDTVSRAVAGEENENDTWLAFYRHTGLTLKQNGIACIRLDHSGKDREKGMRGGSAKYGDVDAVWRLSAISEDTITLECTDHRMPVPIKMLTLVREDFPLAHKPADGGAWQVAADARAQEADEVLEGLGVPSSASVREARKALRESGHKFRNKAIEDAVKLRKMRLDLPLEQVSRGHPGDTGGHRQEVSPAAPSRRGAGGHLPAATRGQGDTDPDELVGCKRCHRPTSNGVASRNGGLCAGCFRDTGQTHEGEDR
jgi:hypothetical protein